MSTKTTLKRIALVAVSTLGFGLMSSVAPATATNGSGSTISSVVVGTIPTARVGESVIIPVTVYTTAAMSASETITLSAQVTSAPSVNLGQTATSLLSKDNTNSKQTAATSNAAGTLIISNVSTGLVGSGGAAIYAQTARGANIAANRSVIGGLANSGRTAGQIETGAASLWGAAAMNLDADASGADTSETGYIVVTPDVAGTYTILVSASSYGDQQAGENYAYVAGDKNATITFTTSATGPSTVTLTKINDHLASSTYGSLVKVTLNGPLAGSEEIVVTTSSGYVAKATAASGNFTSVAPTASTSARMTKSDFVNNIGFVNVLGTSSTATTLTITATSGGGLTSFSGSTTVSQGVAATFTSGATFVGAGGTSVTTGWKSTTGTDNYTIKSTATSSSIEFTFTDPGATKYGRIQVLDSLGKISGAPGTSNTLYFDQSYSIADDDTYKVVTLSHSACGASACFTFTIAAEGTARAVTGASSTGTTISASPSNVRAAAAGSVNVKATVLDQFGLAMSAKSVTVTVAGRNGSRASETLVTNASGEVTTTITDSGTASVTDTVTFTADTTGSATITWGAFTVGSVTVTGGKTASDTYEGQNTTTIATSAAGPHGSAVTITATVKDADGAVLSGVPVTFTVSKGLVRKTATVDYTTVYTNASGVASTQVIDWTEGKQTITATAGGKSGSDYLTWSQTTATSARSISGTASGNKVTATVKDRFGNTVKGVTVTAKTSAGYFGSGTNSTTGTTDVDGNVSFFVTGASGAATVTLSLDKDTYVQSIDVAGEVAETAVTAAVAGTTVGTGADLAAAGVNTVDVAITATDAAATAAEAATDAALEAIDAANAATDAANLAAEAADAATVAAEEARDAADAATAAVEALASEVATLMAALKAQITTLANTVAKIAKKVKA